PLPRWWTWFDVLANLAGYAPLGLLLALALLARVRRAPAWLRATAAAAALSLLMEGLQSYLPQRVPSNVDFALNAAGAALGAGLALVLDVVGVLVRWRRWRERWFAPHTLGAQVLLALWPVGLLFPLPVAFGMGQVLERLEAALAHVPWLAWLPVRELALQPLPPMAVRVCVALGALAPCLLIYTVVRVRWRRALLALAALAAGVAVSALSAALTYGPAYAGAWARPGVLAGVQMAVAAAALLLWLPRRWCARLLMAALAVQLALLNAMPEEPYGAQVLAEWEQGRFIHFHGLAQWVGWLWPYAVMTWTLARMLHAWRWHGRMGR
ncbi:MAG: VanZ family protein, partial [Rhodocyclaceae bacterium]|nr:VanZ family protein [Rhodocyclaceae bacterium]